MSLAVYDHLHTASPIVTWSPLWVVMVAQRVVVVTSVISKQTLNKSSPQLYPNLYNVYKRYPGLETCFGQAVEKEKKQNKTKNKQKKDKKTKQEITIF